MPLRAHLAELRVRVVKSGIAIIAGAVAGWFLEPWVFQALQDPLIRAARAHHVQAAINFNDVLAPFNLRIKLSVYVGLVLASPVWLYQLWAFIVPGLTRREKRYSAGFVSAGVPLFIGGLSLAWFVLPNAVNFFTTFVPKDSTAFTSADEYFSFATRLMLSFGAAFILPLVLVALNFVGVMSALTLAKGWRIAVFLTFLFAAMASPTPDVTMMFVLALPMVALYMGAVGVAWLHDRRVARRRLAEGFGGVADDEASPLDYHPAAVDEPDGS
jgi:sec-independent protein translocase protein TatC